MLTPVKPQWMYISSLVKKGFWAQLQISQMFIFNVINEEEREEKY